MEYYSIIRKNEILPFAATWMDLKGVMPSEISQRKTNTVWYHLYVESKKKKNTTNWWIQKKGSRLTDTENKLGVTSERKEGIGNTEVGK